MEILLAYGGELAPDRYPIEVRDLLSVLILVAGIGSKAEIDDVTVIDRLQSGVCGLTTDGDDLVQHDYASLNRSIRAWRMDWSVTFI